MQRRTRSNPLGLMTRQRWGLVVLIGAVVIGELYLFAPRILRFSADLAEDISFARAPSGQKAFAIGERHFNGQDVFHYDIDRAARYFYTAERLDPNLRYVHHELARIAFLHGDYATAMAQIDTQIALEGDKTANSYYVRGLIEGYMGNYADAATDYEHFLKADPHNWAGINDYAWVLLKAGRFKDAAATTDAALILFPANPWLLNSSAIAHFELGDLQVAHERAQAAEDAVQKVSETDWLHSYPGNDPAIARQGIATFRASVEENLNRINAAIASTTVQ